MATKALGAFERQMERIANSKTAKKVMGNGKKPRNFIAIFTILMPFFQQLIEYCNDQNAERLVKRVGRYRKIAKRRFTRRLVEVVQNDGEALTHAEAAQFIEAGVKDVRANPKDSLATVMELRAG